MTHSKVTRFVTHLTWAAPSHTHSSTQTHTPSKMRSNQLGHKYTGSVTRLAWPGACVIGGTGLEMPSDQSDCAERGDELDHWPGESGEGVR